jgi:hypothetical protein
VSRARWNRAFVSGPAAADSHHHRDQFTYAKLKHGTLKIEGTRASDRIALRLKAGRPDILQVDVGDDGYPDFRVKRKYVAKIAVDARAGDDVVRIDEANGVFTDTIATTIDGGTGNDNLAGGAGVGGNLRGVSCRAVWRRGWERIRNAKRRPPGRHRHQIRRRAQDLPHALLQRTRRAVAVRSTRQSSGAGRKAQHRSRKGHRLRVPR